MKLLRSSGDYLGFEKKSTVTTKQKTRNLRVFLGANNLLFIEITNTRANTTAIIGGKRAIDFK